MRDEKILKNEHTNIRNHFNLIELTQFIQNPHNALIFNRIITTYKRNKH